jgi:hypothetical protein
VYNLHCFSGAIFIVSALKSLKILTAAFPSRLAYCSYPNFGDGGSCHACENLCCLRLQAGYERDQGHSWWEDGRGVLRRVRSEIEGWSFLCECIGAELSMGQNNGFRARDCGHRMVAVLMWRPLVIGLFVCLMLARFDARAQEGSPTRRSDVPASTDNNRLPKLPLKGGESAMRNLARLAVRDRLPSCS